MISVVNNYRNNNNNNDDIIIKITCWKCMTFSEFQTSCHRCLYNIPGLILILFWSRVFVCVAPSLRLKLLAAMTSVKEGTKGAQLPPSCAQIPCVLSWPDPLTPVKTPRSPGPRVPAAEGRVQAQPPTHTGPGHYAHSGQYPRRSTPHTGDVKQTLTFAKSL